VSTQLRAAPIGGAFRGIVDYAGLFPPGSCTMDDAVASYHTYRRSADRWMLGRFVIGAPRLDEFSDAFERLAVPAGDDAWPLSVVVAGDGIESADGMARFRARWDERQVRIASVECKATSAEQVHAIGRLVPASIERFFELPPVGPYQALMAVLADSGGLAKVRTGGVVPAAFPTASAVVDFVASALEQRVRFKATAGLHHAFRGCYRLTYAPDAAHHVMYGFVNLLLAVAELRRRGGASRAEAMLSELDRDAFAVTSDAISWRGEAFFTAELSATRREAFAGFGSCSFREPLEELEAAIS
jgi:hypothetical protein